MSEETAYETRFNTNTTHYGDPEQRAAWEAEQRAWLAHKGIADFSVTYSNNTVTIAYDFVASPEDQPE